MGEKSFVIKKLPQREQEEEEVEDDRIRICRVMLKENILGKVR